MSYRSILRCSTLTFLSVTFFWPQIRTTAAQDATKQPRANKDRLLDAIRPFTDQERSKRNLPALEYCSEGHVNKAGDVVHKGLPSSCLDCTTFASAILHRLSNDDYSNFEANVTGMWGDDLAAKFGLGKAGHNTSVSELLDRCDKKTLPEGAFFFDVRDEKGAKDKKDDRAGGAGHVGFLIVEGTGDKQRVTQIHMSGLKAITKKEKGGLVQQTGFAEFLRASQYGKDKKAGDSSRIWLYKFDAP